MPIRNIGFGRTIKIYYIGYDGYTCIEVEDKAFEKSLDDAKKAVILSAKYLRNFVI